MTENLNHLHIFCQLAKTRSFTEAAHQLKIAQPAVSRTIKALESSLGHQLFIRDSKHVSLTPEGEKLADKLTPLIREVHLSISEFKGEKISRVIRVGGLTEFVEFYLMDLIEDIHARYPHISLELKMQGNKELQRDFRQGNLDILFGLKPLLSENVRSYHYIDQKAHLFTSKESSPSLSKLNQIPFATYRPNDPLLQAYIQTYHRKTSLSNIRQVFTANSHKAIVSYLMKHPNTYAVLPELSYHVDQSLKSKDLRKMPKSAVSSPLYMSYHETNFRSKELQDIIDIFKSKKAN